MHRALDHVAGGVVDLDALARDHRPVAVLEIADRVGERRQRDRVGAEIHFAVAIADRERRALAGADQQIFLAGEQERRARTRRAAAAAPPSPPRPATCRCFISSVTRCAITSVSVSLRTSRPCFSSSSRSSRKFSMMPLCTTASLLGGMRMRVVLGRLAVGRPAGVADADGAVERLAVRAASRGCGACPRRAAASARRAPAWRRRPNRSRDIRAASARRRAAPPPAHGREFRQSRT